MRYLILGAGLQPKAIVHYLVGCPDTSQVLIVDGIRGKAERLAESFADPRVRGETRDVSVITSMAQFMRGFDAVVSAVPYDMNGPLTKAAIRAGTHFVDLGGNNDVEARQIALSEAAAAAGVAVAPAQGIAPGAVSVLVAHLMKILPADKYDRVEIYVGGIPRPYIPPIGYALVFSEHGLFNEYLEETEILQDGKRTLVESLTGTEPRRFQPPFGELEAAYTSGGSSTLTRTFEGKVGYLAYKTLRWPGHWEFIRKLKELGLLSMDPAHGLKGVSPREMTEKAFARTLPRGVEDAIVLSVAVSAENQATQFEMVVTHDAATGLSAMQQTTGFSAAIVARMLANGTISKRGTLTTELDIPTDEFLAGWKRCGFRWMITMT